MAGLASIVLLIVLLGIDGLRQDALYPDNDVNLPSDGVYTEPMGLAGVGQVLGMRSVEDVRYPADPGQYAWTAPALTGEMEKKHVKLRGVTAVFPSITLASWASIFTGEQPGKTGQLGNEFFARDLLGQPGVPAGLGAPPGVVSYSSGSFPGYDTSLAELLMKLRGRCKVCQVMVGFGHAKTGEAGCAGSSASRHSSGNRAGGRLSGDQGDVSKRLNPEHARGLQSRREVSSQLVSPMGGHCPRTQRSVPDLAVMPQWGRTLFKSRAASLSSFGDGPKPDKHKHLRTSHSLKYQHVWLYARFPKP